MSTYLVTFVSGSSQEFEADTYLQDQSDWVFITRGREVLRVALEDVAGITKT